MRWEICFNLSVLRMLSYALDLHWRRRTSTASLQQRGGNRRSTQPDPARAADPPSVASPAKAVCPIGPPSAAALWRQQTPLPSEHEYGVLPYLAYVLYAPLYLAGPIITFQDFAWQLRQRSPPRARVVGFHLQLYSLTMSLWLCVLFMLSAGQTGTNCHCTQSLLQILQYAARLAADWACLELLTRFLYFNSIAKHRIGLRYQQYGLQYGTTEMGKCRCPLLVQHKAYLARLVGWHVRSTSCFLTSSTPIHTPSRNAALTAFWVLCFMWLKFATIWRFMRCGLLRDKQCPLPMLASPPGSDQLTLHSACPTHLFRLAALLDGIEPPENMKRCFANNYDIEVRQCA